MKHTNHKLTYVDFYPEGLKEDRSPRPLIVILGAFGFAALVWLLTFLAFSL